LRAEACASCHADVFAAWQTGRHSKMLQAASPASVVGNFGQRALTLHTRPYVLRRTGDAFYITESYLTGRPVEHRVEYTLGSRRIQHYLTTLDRGRIVVLPPTWDVVRQQWFDNLEIVRPDEQDAQPVQQWNKNCVGCHVSGQDNRYAPKTRTYATAWTDFGTSCERCHGSGESHMALYRTAPPTPPADAAIVRATRLSAERSTAVCAQCHSLRDVVAPGFRAGGAYDDHFVVKLEYTPRKEQDPVYWVDGRPRRFSNDAVGLWQSLCYVRGGATCASCHNPHLPNVDGHAELSPTNNALCTTCHVQIGREVAAHTRHAPASTGSSCVECHMPKEVVSIKARMRDHSMSLPTPENTVRFGIPNACTTCHDDEPASWAVDRLAAWWPDGQRSKMIRRAVAFSGGRAARPDALPELLALTDSAEPPLVRANALGYLRGYSESRAADRLVAALRSEQAVERMVAAASLRHPRTRRALLGALDDSSRAVRVSALVSLVNLGDRPSDVADGARFRRVSAEFAQQARLHEDDPVTQTELGLVHLLNGDLVGAGAALEISLDLEPGAPKATFLLGLVRLAELRTDEARSLLRKVPAGDPYYRAAQERLKKLNAPDVR
jgi:predicted CXXCH cytochrome family protein